MNYDINNLAIVLTKQIEGHIYRLCADTTLADESTLRQAPSFFMIRTAILKCLEQYLDVIEVNIKASPEAEKDLPDELVKKIRAHELERMAGMLIQKIIQSPDHFHEHKCEDDFSRWRSTTKRIVVMKTGKIWKDSQ